MTAVQRLHAYVFEVLVHSTRHPIFSILNGPGGELCPLTSHGRILCLDSMPRLKTQQFQRFWRRQILNAGSNPLLMACETKQVRPFLYNPLWYCMTITRKKLKIHVSLLFNSDAHLLLYVFNTVFLCVYLPETRCAVTITHVIHSRAYVVFQSKYPVRSASTYVDISIVQTGSFMIFKNGFEFGTS